MTVLRAVETADWFELNNLHHWAWFPERSEAGWAWLLSMGKGTAGWVLEDRDGICGFLGNIRQDYVQGDRRLVAATGYSLIVLPRARGGSKLLLDAFRNQAGIFAASIFNGNARSAPIYEREGLVPFPTGYAHTKIVWPLAPLTILSERIARARFRNRRPASELFSRLPREVTSSAASQVVALDPAVDAAMIDRFHTELSSSGSLVADRSAATLRTRFADPDQTAPPILWGWREDDRLTALVLGQLGKMTECEAPILDVIDIAWTGPDSLHAAVKLLAEVKTSGRRLGASRLRLSIVNEATAAVAEQVSGGLSRRRHLHAQVLFLAGVSSEWSPTPYDGDFAFSLRPLPKKEDLVLLPAFSPQSSARVSIRQRSHG